MVVNKVVNKVLGWNATCTFNVGVCRSDDAVVKEWTEKEEEEITIFLNDVLDTDIMHRLESFLRNYGNVSSIPF